MIPGFRHVHDQYNNIKLRYKKTTAKQSEELIISRKYMKSW